MVGVVAVPLTLWLGDLAAPRLAAMIREDPALAWGLRTALVLVAAVVVGVRMVGRR